MSQPVALTIRADASKQIGAGHVLRSLAIAQEVLRHGGTCKFVFAELPKELIERLSFEGVEVIAIDSKRGSKEDATATSNIVSESSSNCLILDGYGFDEPYQTVASNKVPVVAQIDDGSGLGRFNVDIVVNHNVCATAKMYGVRAGGAKLLLGTQYALMRREFIEISDGPEKRQSAIQNLLITLGGGETGAAILPILASLQGFEFSEFRVRIMIEEDDPIIVEVMQAAAGIKFEVDVIHDTCLIAAMMSWADVIVTGGGVSMLEAMFMGLPIAMVVMASNQRSAVEWMARNNCAVYLGDTGSLSPSSVTPALQAMLGNPGKCQAMVAKGRSMVDGLGAGRVVAELTKAIMHESR